VIGLEVTFKCENCGKKIPVTDGTIPNCCGKPMTKMPLDVCIQPAHAEHSRPMEHEDACNNGRSG
jgi:hypothetical protein